MQEEAMFELPEYATLAKQMNETLAGKVVKEGIRGNSPHKFVWYNRTPEEFAALMQSKTVGNAHAKGRWLFVSLEPGYVLVFGECGGKVLYHAPGTKLPEKFHLFLAFTDGSALSATTQMWGAMELYEKGMELHRQYIRDMKPTPTDAEFTFGYFSALIDTLIQGEKRSAKGLLTQDQFIPGLGNSSAQDILFKAKLHPKHPISDFTPSQRESLYNSIKKTLDNIIGQGGRNDEVDLYGRPGGYIRILDSKAAGGPCPVCETKIEKIQYLGGACYFCSQCQR